MDKLKLEKKKELLEGVLEFCKRTGVEAKPGYYLAKQEELREIENKLKSVR